MRPTEKFIDVTAPSVFHPAENMTVEGIVVESDAISGLVSVRVNDTLLFEAPVFALRGRETKLEIPFYLAKGDTLDVRHPHQPMVPCHVALRVLVLPSEEK